MSRVCSAGSIVEAERAAVLLPAAWIPQERAIHDRELEPFGLVNRQDLHCSFVALEADLGALGDRDLARALVREPGQKRRGAQVLLGRRPVQKLGNMQRVREATLAPGQSQQVGGRPGVAIRN